MKCCKNKFERIVEGWDNYIFKKPETEEMAKQRAKICAVCEQNGENWCMMCKCYIPAKVRSRLEKCPANLW